MADVSSVLDPQGTGGVTYWDETEDKPSVRMPEGSYPAHIVEVDEIQPLNRNLNDFQMTNCGASFTNLASHWIIATGTPIWISLQTTSTTELSL